MKKIDTLLFDFDGVVSDTERQYTDFWSGAAKKYGAQGGADFSLKIKGTPLEKILAIYFPRLDSKGRAEVRESLSEFEKKLVFRPVKGAVEFLESARNLRYKTGLVTSSGAAKMRRVFAESDYGRLFDVLVTAEDILRGKPDPMCYLAAASKLGSDPSHCAVFEDSITGLKAAKAANMFTVGLLTTFPRADVERLSDAVIDDFSNASEVFSLLK